jgi:putative endonuclease
MAYSVYIMTNADNNVLYIGVTNNLERRVWEHKNNEGGVFTGKYKCVKLVYYEDYNNIDNAIKREKNLKDWKRAWKEQLICTENPEYKDLSTDWQ